ncbi:MAG: hypothetical protein ACE5IM_02675 [Nitrospinota bacterium]
MWKIRSLAVVWVGVLLTACSTFPPPTPVRDLRKIGGMWEGTMTLGEPELGSVTRGATWIIEPNGSYVMITPTGRSAGTLRLKDGLIYFTDGPRLSGIAFLYEIQGKRVLLSWHDDASVSAGWSPAGEGP